VDSDAAVDNQSVADHPDEHVSLLLKVQAFSSHGGHTIDYSHLKIPCWAVTFTWDPHLPREKRALPGLATRGVLDLAKAAREVNCETDSIDGIRRYSTGRGERR
jgi:hypothetical protein